MESWEEVTATVKQQSDIVQVIGEHVDLKRSGVRYLGRCPFHQEKTPSFSVHPGQQFYYCFGCGAKGDVFNFIMDFYHVEFKDALKRLADRCHVTLPQRRQSAQERERERQRALLFAVNDRAAAIYRDYLLQATAAEPARRYLRERGIDPEVEQRYRLGYAPAIEQVGWNFLGNQLDQEAREAALQLGLLVAKEHGGSYDRFRDRIVCPILDSQGRVAGFGGRILGEGTPKYLNSPESAIYNKSRLLFGYYQQRDAIRKERRATLVEGNFDLLALVTYGYEPVVAPLGTALTREQIRLLKPLVDEVVLLFDGDEAGIKAAERAAPLFLAEGLGSRVALLPEQHDPDSFVRRYGVERLKEIVGSAETLPEFVLGQCVQRHGLGLAGKNRIIEDLRPLLVAADSPLQRSVVASHFADLLGVDTQLVLAQLAGDPSHVEQSAAARAATPTARLEPTPDKSVRRLISFLILNPNRLAELEEAGAAEVLAGSIGEIIFLQMQKLAGQRGRHFQPEDVLSALPDGEERTLVASLLLAPDPVDHRYTGDDEGTDGFEDILIWLRRVVLKNRSDALVNALIDAQKNNDFNVVTSLLRQKMEVDAELKTL